MVLSFTDTAPHYSALVLLRKTPRLGPTVAASSGHRNRARDWRGAEQPRRRRGRSAHSAEPRKARFFAEQKMRPNYALHGEAL
jgi:hypothetical protein